MGTTQRTADAAEDLVTGRTVVVTGGAPPLARGDGARALDHVSVVDALRRAIAPQAAGDVFDVASGTPFPGRALVAAMDDTAGVARVTAWMREARR